MNNLCLVCDKCKNCNMLKATIIKEEVLYSCLADVANECSGNKEKLNTVYRTNFPKIKGIDKSINIYTPTNTIKISLTKDFNMIGFRYLLQSFNVGKDRDFNNYMKLLEL